MTTPTVHAIIQHHIEPNWKIKSEDIMIQLREHLKIDDDLHDYWENAWVEPIFGDWTERRRLDLKQYPDFRIHPLFQYTPIYITFWGGYFIRKRHEIVPGGAALWIVDYKREIYVAMEKKPFHIMDVTECRWAVPTECF